MGRVGLSFHMQDESITFAELSDTSMLKFLNPAKRFPLRAPVYRLSFYV